MTDETILCIKRIGRDEAANRTTIGLPELDALCDEAIRRGAEIERLKALLVSADAVIDELGFVEPDWTRARKVREDIAAALDLPAPSPGSSRR